MSTTYQEYRDRVQYKGKTKRDYVNKKVEESIDSLIEDSQYGFTITKDGEEYDVAILSTSSTQDYEKANIIAHNNVGLDKGSLFEWNDDYWIILQKMFRPEQPGFNGNAYKCTGVLKWIDDAGKLQERPGYIRAGRITNSLSYTPDVNYKYDNVLLHDTDWSMIAAIQQDLTLHNEMRFIIKGHAYRVTNIDNVSIDNVSILSMVDDKLLDTDDIVNGVATSEFDKYILRSNVETPINLYAGDIKEIPMSVILNGQVVEEDITYTSLTPTVVEISDDKMIGRAVGDGIIRCALTKNDLIYNDIEISVTAQHIEDTEVCYINGPDYIEWNSSATYKLSTETDTSFNVEWRSKIKHDSPIFTNNSVTISIKDKYSGNIIVTGVYQGQEISKKIYIKTN